jgi:6-phosphogluconolactonase
LKLDDLPESNRPHLLPINTQLLSPLDADGTAVDASIAAKVSADYERALRLLTGAPAEDYSTPLIIDCLLLGMGPDGHTCSLFPEHPLLHRRDCSVSWLIDSPKPPAARITLTMAAIEAARSAFIVASGDGKRPILQQVFSAVQSSDFPVAMVNRMRLLNSIDPSTERVQWYLDQAAWPL